MIQTFAITIFIEGVVCLLYSIWRKKPARPILLTSVLGNLLTQSLLWIALYIFFQHYLATLLIAEILIWLIESLLFYRLWFNQLDFTESVRLSLIMNLCSFGLGWLMPL